MITICLGVAALVWVLCLDIKKEDKCCKFTKKWRLEKK